MSKPKLTNWYTYYRGRITYYESQPAALAAIDLIIASHESGIWDSQASYLSLNCERGVDVDNDLLNSRFSPSSLIPDHNGREFRIDVYLKNKEDWIFKYGSDLLQQSIRAGYDCNEGYLAERLARDYPDFTLNKWKYEKVDTPNEKCLYACLAHKYAYCSIDKKNYYITIDDYLGKYQLVKRIDLSVEITRLKLAIDSIDPAIAVTDDKKEWILEYGSDLLQQSLLAGYDCNNRYLQERLIYEYPGFEINSRKYPKVDSPDESCLDACWGYEGSYCSSNNNRYYVTIDNFLGKYQLIKPIDALGKLTQQNAHHEVAISNSFTTKIEKYARPTAPTLIIAAASVSTFLVVSFTILYMFYAVWLNI